MAEERSEPASGSNGGMSNGGAAWVLRGLAALGALAVLLGVGVAVATGPVTAGSPLVTAAASDTAPGTTDPDVPQPLPTQSSAGAATDPLTTSTDIPYIPYDQRPSAVFIGDSITRGMTEPGSWDVEEHSWYYGLLDDTTGVVRFGGSVSEVGMTTSWMAGQVWNALALSPDILIVLGGTNDISGEIDVDFVISNFQRIKDAADILGVPMAVGTVPPRSEPEADARAVLLNSALTLWAAQEGVILLDTGAPLRDPAGGWIYGYTGDGLHPTPEASRLMAEAAAKALREIPLGV